MSAEKTTTASKVIPNVFLLKQRIKDCELGDDQIVCKMQKFILAELDRRFEKAEFTTHFAVASILDPRFKKIYFQSNLATSRVINYIQRNNERFGESCNLKSSNTTSKTR